MDHKTSLTQHVNAPADTVWAVMSDIPGSAATLSGIDSIQMLTDGPYGEGTRWKETRTMMGRVGNRGDVGVPVPRRRRTAGRQHHGEGPPGRRRLHLHASTLAERDGGTDLTLTFGAEVIKPTRCSKTGDGACSVRSGMRITRKALAKDLAEIAAKAESPLMARRTAADKAPKVTAPRLAPVRPGELRDDPAPDFRRGSGTTASGTAGRRPTGWNLAAPTSPSANSRACPSMRRSCAAPLSATASWRRCTPRCSWRPGASLRDVEIGNPRWGSAELYESGWQSVRIDGGKLDYVNLRGSKLTDVQISDCIINELDLGSCTATRVALKNCTIGTLDFTGARLKDFDLRGTDFRTISGLGSLAGLVIDDYQLTLLAPLLAAHLGVVVA